MKDSERKRPPVKLSLDPSIAAMLEKTGNASRYVDSVVEQRWQDWQAALNLLMAAHWAPSEVLAVCDVLNGTYHEGPLPPSYLALELHDAQRLDGTAVKWEVPLERWSAIVTELGDHDHPPVQLAWALWTISREFWAGNDEVERRIRRLSQTTPAE